MSEPTQQVMDIKDTPPIRTNCINSINCDNYCVDCIKCLSDCCNCIGYCLKFLFCFDVDEE